MYLKIFKNNVIYITGEMKDIVKNNFYCENYYIESNIIYDILPEILLGIFILYSLITIFNDSKQSIFQYYRWCFLFVIIFIWLFIKMFLFVHSSVKILFGFTWIVSYFTLFSKFLIVSLTCIILLISYNKIQQGKTMVCIIEFPLIIGFSIFFILLLTSSYDFFSVYLAIEGLSLTLYTMAGMLHLGIVSIEASIKYYALGAISTGIMLFGISILFGLVGSLDFLEVQIFLGSSKIVGNIFEIKMALIFIIFGLFFKISAFPCHIWVADVYEGVWTPVTAFFAIVVKISILLFFIRLIFTVMFNFLFLLQSILVFSALGSMFVGAFGALKQTRIKRFIAYTSINQVGFLLLGISCCNLAGIIATNMYLILYAFMSISFFTILLNVDHIVTKRGIIYLSDFYGISIFNSESSKHLVITILSMAGLPPLGGFIGKLFIYFAAMEARLDFIVFFSMVISVVSTYYYLGLIRHIWFEKTNFIKIYYFNNNIYIINVLRLISLVLVFFIVFVPFSYSKITEISISCLCPLIL